MVVSLESFRSILGVICSILGESLELSLELFRSILIESVENPWSYPWRMLGVILGVILYHPWSYFIISLENSSS